MSQIHDQRFKNLIQEFFAEFMRLFFKDWAARLDCSAPEWLQQEVFPDPPDGPKRVLDLVAKLPAKKPVPGYHSEELTEWLALIHFEIESPDNAARLRPNMVRRYLMLRDEHGLPVLPIAIFLKVGLEGTGIEVFRENFWELETTRFQFLYVALPGLNAVEYLNGENPLGVALSALMNIPKEKIAWLGAEALKRIKEAPNLTERQRFLLGECVQAYLPMDAKQRKEYEELLKAKRYQGVKAMNQTVYEKGIETGIERGIEQGTRNTRLKTLTKLAELKFGRVPSSFVKRLNSLPTDRLDELLSEIFAASKLKDLDLSKN